MSGERSTACRRSFFCYVARALRIPGRIRRGASNGVEAREARIELYQRAGGEWIRRETRAGEAIELAAIGCALAVDDVYGAMGRS
jgi:hypothetical protein